jgi:hypothetical protein
MRIFITKADTDLQELSATLLRRSSDADTALERVKALNPQIEDFRRLSAGTVLLLPDGPEFKARAGIAVSGEGFDTIAEEVGHGIKSVKSRAEDRFAALRADHAEVAAALKSAAARRLVESDPALRSGLEAAAERFRENEKRAVETQQQLVEVQKFALAEFEKLQKMLSQ